MQTERHKKSNFKDINVDFSTSTNVGHGGKSTLKVEKGTSVGKETGKKNGAMIGLAVDQSGKIYASYDNGNTELLGQIAVAQFANASGLEKIGDNCYQTTLNSGEFDGVGVAVDADGSKINSGQLEMSNVDLSGQFYRYDHYAAWISGKFACYHSFRYITGRINQLKEIV